MDFLTAHNQINRLVNTLMLLQERTQQTPDAIASDTLVPNITAETGCPSAGSCLCDGCLECNGCQEHKFCDHSTGCHKKCTK